MVFIKRKMFSIALGRRFCFRCFHKPFRKFKIRCFQPYVRKSATIVGSTCPVTHTHTQKVVACKWVVVQHTHTQKNAFKKPKPKSVRVKLSNFKIFEFVFVKSSKISRRIFSELISEITEISYFFQKNWPRYVKLTPLIYFT